MKSTKSFQEYLIECNDESIKNKSYDNLKNFKFHNYLTKERKHDGRILK